jgi:hypothetical protein
VTIKRNLFYLLVIALGALAFYYYIFEYKSDVPEIPESIELITPPATSQTGDFAAEPKKDEFLEFKNQFKVLEVRPTHFPALKNPTEFNKWSGILIKPMFGMDCDGGECFATIMFKFADGLDGFVVRVHTKEQTDKLMLYVFKEQKMLTAEVASHFFKDASMLEEKESWLTDINNNNSSDLLFKERIKKTFKDDPTYNEDTVVYSAALWDGDRFVGTVIREKEIQGLIKKLK